MKHFYAVVVATLLNSVHAAAFPTVQQSTNIPACNTPQNRQCWGEYDIHTDYLTVFPDTKVVREVGNSWGCNSADLADIADSSTILWSVTCGLLLMDMMYMAWYSMASFRGQPLRCVHILSLENHIANLRNAG